MEKGLIPTGLSIRGGERYPSLVTWPHTRATTAADLHGVDLHSPSLATHLRLPESTRHDISPTFTKPTGVSANTNRHMHEVEALNTFRRLTLHFSGVVTAFG